MALRDFLRNHWPAVAIAVTVVAIVIAALVILRHMPPRMIVMATGSKGGTFYDVGERYRAALASAGVQVRLVPTGGSAENLALLLDPHSGVSVGLIQGGTIGAAASSNKLESLGTVFYEPLWLFYKPGLRNNKGFVDLRGRRISVGPVGSGGRALSVELLKRNGIDGQNSELLALAPEAAAEKLLAGEIDAAATLNGWEAPIVQKLITDEDIELFSFAARADAYVALYPSLDKVVVPRGVGDLAKDLPPTDVTLFAPKASLVVHKDLHPAIQYLLLDAAVRIHSRPGIFQHANQFPAAESIDLPLSREALQFYKSGRPFLHNYLPFWVAELFGALILLLIPILGVIYPLIRFLPSLYSWLMRSKIARIYGELRFLEDEIMEARRTGGDISAMVAQFDHLEEQANHLRIPVAYASMLYELRDHIDVVRERLQKPTR
jgi:TRAP transporter TAXI family solute receptor